jgi:hemerythrin superfamily protein
MDAIELLTTQHAEVEALFEKLEQETDEVSRRELVGRLVDRLTMHTALEEEIFYPALGALPGGASMAGHARDEHRKVTQLLDGLREPHLEGRLCRDRLQELRRTVEHHVAEEEQDMMPRARSLGSAVLRDLAHWMEDRMHAGEVTAMRAAGSGRG